MTYGWIWIVCIVFGAVIMAFTKKLDGICLLFAAVVALVMDLFDLDIAWQMGAMAVGIIATRILMKIANSASASKADINSIIGEKCVVTERIDNYAGCGQAKVNGQVWSARGAFEDDIFEEGEVLQVVALEGVKLICKK